MNNRRYAVVALIAAGLLWGTTVPLSKLALAWLSPGWLTAMRFGLAAAVLLAAARRSQLRAAFTPKVLAAGALGYGGSVVLQNAGIARTSVTQAALLIGAVPVMVAVMAAVWQRAVAPPVAWAGFVVSLAGVGLVTAGSSGGGASLGGDGLVLASLLLSAGVTVAQGRLLAGRDPVAVTAVQFLGATVFALVVAGATEGTPTAPASAGPLLAVVALAAAGTLLPFTLFAFGQSRVSAEVAGAFLNLEPLVGAITGAIAFGDPVGPVQLAGGLAIVTGIGLSSLPLIGGRRARDVAEAPVAVAAAAEEAAMHATEAVPVEAVPVETVPVETVPVAAVPVAAEAPGAEEILAAGLSLVAPEFAVAPQARRARPPQQPRLPHIEFDECGSLLNLLGTDPHSSNKRELARRRAHRRVGDGERAAGRPPRRRAAGQPSSRRRDAGVECDEMMARAA